QDAARVKRKLADERAALASSGFLPAGHQSLSEPNRGLAVLPWPRPAAEPSWHVIGTSVTLWLHRQDGAGDAEASPRSAGPSTAHAGAQLSRVGVADRLAAAPVLPVESEPADDTVPDAAPAGEVPAGLVLSEPGPADPGLADAALPDAVPVPAAP